MNFRNEDLWVVIPTYNRANDLIDCLTSLEEAGIQTTQIIIIDNHSQDNTVEKVTQYFPKTKLFLLHDNLGAAKASNIGFKYAVDQDAAYILRLDSDTIVAPNFSKSLLEAASSDSNFGVIGPKIYYFDKPELIWYAGMDAQPLILGAYHGFRDQQDSFENDQFREVDYVWGAAMLIKKEVLQQTGGFDTDFFIYQEEIDFCRRVKNLGFKIVFVPESHIWHKVGSAANSPWTAYQWNRSKMLLFRKHARNIFHMIFLIIYAYGYALIAPLSQGKLAGNRGPLKDALRGLWHGLTLKY